MFTNPFRLICFALLLCIPLAQAWSQNNRPIPDWVDKTPAVIRFSDLELPVRPGTTGVAFFTVFSEADDAITNVTSDCCTAVEMHDTTMVEGVMRMRPLEKVNLLGGTPVVFQSGGMHVMLIGLKKPLKPGDQVTLTFKFAHAPEQKQLFTAAAPRLHPEADSSTHP